MKKPSISYAGAIGKPGWPFSYEVHLSEDLVRISEAPCQTISFYYNKYGCRELSHPLYDTNITQEQVVEMFDVAQQMMINPECDLNRQPIQVRGIVEMFVDLYVGAEGSTIEEREEFRALMMRKTLPSAAETSDA